MRTNQPTSPLDFLPQYGAFFSDALFYAVAGDAPSARSALDSLIAAAGGRNQAIDVLEARQLYALGELVEAERALARQLSSGEVGPDLAALASVALPDGGDWAEMRMQSGSPGERADAACDLAWLRIRADDEAAARTLLAEALELCPGHVEARAWLRFCDDHAGGVTAARRAAQDDPLTQAAADLIHLQPRRDNAWFAPIRLDCRIFPTLGRARAREGRALQRLTEQGVTTRIFATDGDYAAMPDVHPLVECEEAVDLALALEVEGRCPVAALERAWARACAFDDTAVTDAANVLVAIGTRLDEALPVALAAATHLCERAPREALWQAYRAAFLARSGHHDDAVVLASTTIGALPLDPVSMHLLVDAFRRSGQKARADKLLTRATLDPQLAALARRLQDRPHDSCMTMVTDRTRPRYALGAAEAATGAPS